MNKRVRSIPARRKPINMVPQKEDNLKQSHLMTIYGIIIALAIVVTIYTTT